MSNSNEFERKIARLKKEIEREVYDRLPRKVGVVAVRHFKQNFQEGGFVEGGGKAVEKDAPAGRQGYRRKLYSADLSTQSLDAFHSVRTLTGVEVIIDNPCRRKLY